MILILGHAVAPAPQGLPYRNSYCEGGSQWCYCVECLRANALKRCIACPRYMPTRLEACSGCKTTIPTKKARLATQKLAKATVRIQALDGRRRQVARPNISRQFMTAAGLGNFSSQSVLEAASTTPVLMLTLGAVVNETRAVQTGLNMTSNTGSLIVGDMHASKNTI